MHFYTHKKSAEWSIISVLGGTQSQTEREKRGKMLKAKAQGK